MLNEETPGLGMLAKSGKERWSGASVHTAQRTGRNRAYRVTGSANSGAGFPNPGRQTIGNFTIGCRLMHATGGLEAFAQAASQGSEGAFESILQAEVRGLIADSKKDLEVDFFGNELGILAKVNGDPAGATVTLDAIGDDPAASSLIAFVDNGNRYFSAGQRVEFVDEVDGTVRGTVGVLASVATANRTQFTMDAAIAAIENDDLVVRAGTWTSGAGGGAAAGFSYTGLESIIDDADASTLPSDVGVGNGAGGYNLDSLQGVDRSTAAGQYAQSTVIDLANVGLTQENLHNLVYAIEEKGNSYPDVFLCPRSVQFLVANTMTIDVRYQPQVFPGGFKAKTLLFNGGDKDIAIVVSRECPWGRLYALNFEAIEEFVLQDYELIETDGSFLRQDALGGDVWDFTMRKFSNIGSLDPRSLGKIVRIGGVNTPFFGLGAGRVYDL